MFPSNSGYDWIDLNWLSRILLWLKSLWIFRYLGRGSHKGENRRLGPCDTFVSRSEGCRARGGLLCESMASQPLLRFQTWCHLLFTFASEIFFSILTSKWEHKYWSQSTQFLGVKLFYLLLNWSSQLFFHNISKAELTGSTLTSKVPLLCLP